MFAVSKTVWRAIALIGILGVLSNCVGDDPNDPPDTPLYFGVVFMGRYDIADSYLVELSERDAANLGLSQTIYEVGRHDNGSYGVSAKSETRTLGLDMSPEPPCFDDGVVFHRQKTGEEFNVVLPGECLSLWTMNVTGLSDDPSQPIGWVGMNRDTAHPEGRSE